MITPLFACLLMIHCEDSSTGSSIGSNQTHPAPPEKEKKKPSDQKANSSDNKSRSKEKSDEDQKRHPALLDPSKADEKAPGTFRVQMKTTKGTFVIRAHREWSPHGVDRFYNLVKIGYFRDVAFFRVIDKFMAQFGIHGDPEVNSAWRKATIPDDPVKKSNRRGFVTFAKTRAPNSRSTQLFINYKDNSMLDNRGFAPIGKVVKGMNVVDKLHAGYGEGAPRGNGPSQAKLQKRGNKYLKKNFPKLDYIKKATILENDKNQ